MATQQQWQARKAFIPSFGKVCFSSRSHLGVKSFMWIWDEARWSTVLWRVKGSGCVNFGLGHLQRDGWHDKFQKDSLRNQSDLQVFWGLATWLWAYFGSKETRKLEKSQSSNQHKSADDLCAQVFCKGLDVYERVPLSDSFASLRNFFLASNGDWRGEWRCGKRIRWLSEARKCGLSS